MQVKIDGRQDFSDYPEIEVLSKRKRSVTAELGDITIADVEEIPGVKRVTPDELAPPEAVASHLGHIQVGEFWNAFDTRGEHARICVADLGCDPAHPDIHVDEWIEFDSSGREVTGSTPHFDVTDSTHGQKTSSMVVGKDNYDGEYIGVAPECEFYAAKIGDTGASFSAMASAIDWAVDNECHAISLSFGGSSLTNILVDEMEEAWESDTIVVGSAGNTSNLTIPGAEYPCVGVGRVEDDGTSIEPSGTGHGTVDSDMWDTVWPDEWPDSYEKPDVCAVGQFVLSAAGPSSGWSGASGTSISAPQVAGVIGLLQSLHYEEQGTYADSETIVSALKEAAVVP